MSRPSTALAPYAGGTATQGRAAELLAEFNNVVGPQKAQLALRLPALFKQYYEVAGKQLVEQQQIQSATILPAAVVKSSVNEGSHQQGGGGKRPRSGHSDRSPEEEQVFKDIMSLIQRKLWQKKESQPFRQPVDIVLYGIPDYYEKIKQPMDLGTVKAKLQRREYATPMEANEDIRLIWRNCATYNAPGNSVRIFGDICAGVWELAWKEARLEDQWHAVTGHKTSGVNVSHKVSQLSQEVRAAVASFPTPATANHPSAAASGRQMSDIEKRKLSIQLSELQGEHLTGVLDVLASTMPHLAHTQQEVEVDIDQLPSSTLWKLKQYVDAVDQRAAPKPYGAVASKQLPQAYAAAGGGGGAARTISAAASGGMGGMSQATSQQSMGNDDNRAYSGGGSRDSTRADSPGEVKGSTMDDPHAAGRDLFVKDHRAAAGQGLVAGSVSNPPEQSAFLKDRQVKPEVQVNAAAWNVSALQQPAAGEEDTQQDADDKLWMEFQTIEEAKKKQAEEQARIQEQKEEEARRIKAAAEAEAARAAALAEEAAQKLKEEEARVAEQQQRERMEQCDKEVDAIKARQGTANLLQQNAVMSTILGSDQPNPEAGLAAVGLCYKDDDADVTFDDDE